MRFMIVMQVPRSFMTGGSYVRITATQWYGSRDNRSMCQPSFHVHGTPGVTGRESVSEGRQFALPGKQGSANSLPRKKGYSVKLSQLVATATAKMMGTADIPKDIVIDANIARYAHGNKRNQYRGRIDRAGTVRARAYIAGSVEELKGSSFTAKMEAHTQSEFVGADNELVKVEFDDVMGTGVFVVLWAPCDADIDSVTINV